MNLPEFEEMCISFNCGGIDILAKEAINEAQLGYSHLEGGKNLCGLNDGDWKTEWVVIGRDTLQGDPIFIDSSVEGFPVYTAPHGEGDWDQEIISESYNGFIKILMELKKISVGREHPVGLENKPMTQLEYDNFIDFCRENGAVEDTFYWELLISDDESEIGPEYNN